jgi:hypothetical protein
LDCVSNCRNLIVVDWSCMCKKIEEIVNHLLLHNEVARALWNFAFRLCGLEWVMSQWVADFYARRGHFGSFQSAAVWKMIPPCLMWCI